jgi:transitional endoplasmic reticulum ATPase
MSAKKPVRHPEVSLYHRHAFRVTEQPVLHPIEKQALIDAAPFYRRARHRVELEAEWAKSEAPALQQARDLLAALRDPLRDVVDALTEMAQLGASDLRGKVKGELNSLRTAMAHLDTAAEALDRSDFGAAGAAVENCERDVSLLGGRLVVAMHDALGQAAISKDFRVKLEDNVAERRQAKIQLDNVRAAKDHRLLIAAQGRMRSLEATGYRLATEILRNQVSRPSDAGSTSKVGRDNSMQVVPSAQCETFADVGGLDDVKEQLRQTIGTILDRPDEAARYQVVHNGLLFYGPPGTGKNLLSRALAGEYGLRYLRFSPASIASAYIHEAATNLRNVFELAKSSTPCLLYLDEIDTIASDRGDQPSADHREIVTQLMICLEEYRTVPGLVIAAGTNELDRLDPALREGRFDAKILIPLPDPTDRAAVLKVHLERRGDAVDWTDIDLADLSKRTAGYNAAALETVCSLASQAALRARAPIDQQGLVDAITSRGGQHKIALEDEVRWDDVVLTPSARERVLEILSLFSQPELAKQIGVKPPAGIILYGPPGTGKTTIAKAMASQLHGSFYEMSAADLLSKWAGESEQRVAKLFDKARTNRPSVIFIDEIDSLLRRRSAETASKWEERVLSQFLRELDGLKGGDGVLLVGATNRLDTIDNAIVGRRLEPVEIGLPGGPERLLLLQALCKDLKLAKGLSLRELAGATEGLSGADLRRLRDAAGMKALSRATRSGAAGAKTTLSVTKADFLAALDLQSTQISMAEV